MTRHPGPQGQKATLTLLPDLCKKLMSVNDSRLATSLTVESVDALLPLRASDSTVNPLKSIAKVLQEVFENIQHSCHLLK